MALPTVKINSSGSNTAASGAGPGDGVASGSTLFGTAAATAASTTVTLLVDNPDLSGVATDGSAVIWVGSSSGKQFAKITGVNNTAGVKTVTVSDAFANTESGKNWGIGGKRATCAGSLQLFLDFRAGWIIDIQSGETLTADIVVTPGGQSAILPSLITSTTYSGTWGSQPTLQTATAGVAIFDIRNCRYLQIDALHLKSTVVTPAEANSGIIPKDNSIVQADYITVSRCIIEGFFNAIDARNGAPSHPINNLIVDECEIYNCTAAGIQNDPGSTQIFKSYIHDNVGYGCITGVSPAIAHRTVFANNGTSGLKATQSTGVCSITECYFVANGSTGTTAADRTGCNLSFASNPNTLVFSDNICWNNGKTAADGQGARVGSNVPSAGVVRNNAFGGTLQTTQSDFTTLANLNVKNTITLTVDPRTSTTDYLLNATANGGALCRQVATQCANASATATNPDLGAVPSGGGVAGSTDPGIANVKSGTAYTIAGSALTGTLAVPATPSGGMRGGFAN